MRRTVRKPGFWVVLIVATFVLNLLAAWITVHKHLRIPTTGDFLISPASSSSSMASMSFISTNNDKNIIIVNDQVPENIVWHRMLEEEEEEKENFEHSQGGVRKNNNNNNNNSFDCKNASANNTDNVESQFHRDVKEFVARTTGTTRKSHKACFLPSSSACHVTKYSVVVLSSGTNIRKLFLNLMSFVSYPSVLNITLILNADNRSALRNDDSYGTRILDWDKQKTVRLILSPTNSSSSSSSHWSSIANLQPKSEAVLLIDGDLDKSWTGRSIKNDMYVWRQHSRSLFASQLAMSADRPSCPFPALHGMIFHRDFLCYLKHPILGTMKDQIKSRGWDAVKRSLPIFLNAIGEGYIQNRQKETTTTTTTTTTINNADDGDSMLSIRDEELELSNKVLDYLGCPCSINGPIHKRESPDIC